MIHPDRQVLSPKLLAHHDFKVANQSSHPAALRSNERLVIDVRVTDKYVMVIDGNKGHVDTLYVIMPSVQRSQPQALPVMACRPLGPAKVTKRGSRSPSRSSQSCGTMTRSAPE